MRREFAVAICALCLVASAVMSALHENVGPSSDQKTIVTKVPSGKYALIQTKTHLKSCGEEGGLPCYQTTVRFSDKSKRDQLLPPVGLQRQASYQAGAGYAISPDERWFVRDQHLFAGCNILVLYQVETGGKVRLAQSDLVDLGLNCVLEDLHRANKTKLSSREFFHFSGEDVVWDPDSGGFRFQLFARPDPPDPSIHDCVVRYDVRTGKMTHGKIPLYDSRTGDDTETVTVGATDR